MTTRKTKSSKARLFHRLIGAGAAVFIIFMVSSGLAINHSNGLGLDQRQLTQSLLLDWYGLGEPEYIHSFELGKNWLSFAGSQVYLDGGHVATLSNAIGAVSNSDMIIAAGSNELLLLDHAGNLVERTTWSPPGAGSIDAIGLLNSGVVVLKSEDQLWSADRDLLGWKQSNNIATPIWSVSAVAPAIVHKAIKEQYRGNGLSLERVLLDLHSGRIFGTIGILVYDLLALAVGLMAISGMVLWIRGRRNGKTNGNHRNSGR